MMAVRQWVLAGCVAVGFGAPMAARAIGDPAQDLAAAAPAAEYEEAQVELRFVQVGGPADGHVRVDLSPQSRQLTVLEARSAAQQAFLQTLNEPGLGKPLRRITVVVRLAPPGQPSTGAQVIDFRHKGGRDWAVTAGE